MRVNAIHNELASAVLTAYDDDGFLTVAIDSHTSKDDDKALPAYEALHPLGVIARPRDPETDGEGNATLGATVLRMIESNSETALALADPRATPKLPRLKKGGVMVYGDTGKDTIPFILFDGDTGGFQTYVPHFGTASTIAIDVTTQGSESIQIVHGAGMGFSMAAGGKNDCILHNKAGDAFVNVNDDGITLNGNLQTIGATQLGAQATPTDPVPVAVALAPALQAFSTANAAFLAQVMSAINTLLPGGVTGPVPTIAPTVAAVNVTAS